jgi:hydrogenase maturation factor
MIRNVRSEDAQALVSICKTALCHETDSVTMKRRIQELSLNDSYYIAVYEDDNDHRVLGFIQA